MQPIIQTAKSNQHTMTGHFTHFPCPRHGSTTHDGAQWWR